MSYVRRPSRRASVPSYAATTCAPETSSNRGACQPPNGNPTGSSSGPPGDCPTRSRVANISMWMRPIAVLLMCLGRVFPARRCGMHHPPPPRTARGRSTPARRNSPRVTGPWSAVVLQGAELDGPFAGGRGLAGPVEGGVEIGRLDHPEAAHLLLGLRVGAI